MKTAIIGKIVDFESKFALPNVNILVKNSSGEFFNGFTSDVEGLFNISAGKQAYINMPSDTYTFEFKYIGYGTQKIEKNIPSTNQGVDGLFLLDENGLNPTPISPSEAADISDSSKVFQVIRFGTIELKDEYEELEEFEALSEEVDSVKGIVLDKTTNQPLPGVSIVSSLSPTLEGAEKVNPTISDSSPNDGEFRLQYFYLDQVLIPKEPRKEPVETTHTVVVGGMSYATDKWMREQWELAGLSTKGVEFINYTDKTKFKNLIKDPTIVNIMGFSAGGVLIWEEINSTKEYQFIGLIDPTTYNVPESIPSNVKVVSNSSNWKSFKRLYPNMLKLERKGLSIKSSLKHKLIPLNFFKTYSKEFPPPEAIVEEDDKQNRYEPFDLIFSLEDYEQLTIPAVKGNKTLKSNLGKVRLTPIEIEQPIIENKNLTEEQNEELDSNTKKDFISGVLKNIFRNIQDRLIPSILKQIATFGISNFNNEILENISSIPKTCPKNVDELNKLISKKNKLTKQLNNIYKSINLINKFLGIPPITIKAAEVSVLAAKIQVNVQAFIPSTVATPIPVGPIFIVKDLIEKFEDLIDLLKGKLGAGSLQLKLILEEFKKVLVLLNILDALLQTCAESLPQSTPTSTQTAVSNQLLASTQQQSQQLSPVVTNVNGFDMAVVEVEGKTELDIKRRRAVARNKAGIIMLKGEPSFSSDDQILIDELVFYIQQNDLKAE